MTQYTECDRCGTLISERASEHNDMGLVEIQCPYIGWHNVERKLCRDCVAQLKKFFSNVEALPCSEREIVRK